MPPIHLEHVAAKRLGRMLPAQNSGKLLSKVAVAAPAAPLVAGQLQHHMAPAPTLMPDSPDNRYLSSGLARPEVRALHRAV